VYAFGALLAELVTGIHPDRPPPSEGATATIPRLSVPLASLVARCRAVDPAGRPSDMDAVLDELIALAHREEGIAPLREIAAVVRDLVPPRALRLRPVDGSRMDGPPVDGSSPRPTGVSARSGGTVVLVAPTAALVSSATSIDGPPAETMDEPIAGALLGEAIIGEARDVPLPPRRARPSRRRAARLRTLGLFVVVGLIAMGAAYLVGLAIAASS
jgi:hypothetical protein